MSTSFASVSPMVARTPSLPYCRRVSPASWAAAAKAPDRSPRPNHTKFASVSGMNHPWPRSASTTRARSATRASTRSLSSSNAPIEATAAACAIEFTPNGTAVLRSALATGSCATAYPTRSPASP